MATAPIDIAQKYTIHVGKLYGANTYDYKLTTDQNSASALVNLDTSLSLGLYSMINIGCLVKVLTPPIPYINKLENKSKKLVKDYGYSFYRSYNFVNYNIISLEQTEVFSKKYLNFTVTNEDIKKSSKDLIESLVCSSLVGINSFSPLAVAAGTSTAITTGAKVALGTSTLLNLASCASMFALGILNHKKSNKMAVSYNTADNEKGNILINSVNQVLNNAQTIRLLRGNKDFDENSSGVILDDNITCYTNCTDGMVKISATGDDDSKSEVIISNDSICLTIGDTKLSFGENEIKATVGGLENISLKEGNISLCQNLICKKEQQAADQNAVVNGDQTVIG